VQLVPATLAGLVVDVVDDGFSRQVTRERLSLRLIARVSDRLGVGLGLDYRGIDLLALVEQAELIGRLAALAELALLRQAELLEHVPILRLPLVDLNIFLVEQTAVEQTALFGDSGSQAENDLAQFFGVVGKPV